jgi:hypothetical protein
VRPQSHGADHPPRLRLASAPPASSGPPRSKRRRVLVTAAAALALVGAAAGLTYGRPRPALFAPPISGPDRLMTNEYTHWNPQAPDSHSSKDWDVTSGSLFVHDGVAWSGTPDKATPNADSSNGSGSSVFRMTTRRHDFGDVTVSLSLRNLGLTSSGRAVPSEIDGVHVFLRWQTPAELYVVSLNRRDNLVVIKKKRPGGTTNGGTYVTLGQTRYSVPYGAWQRFAVQIKTSGGDLVAISVRHGDRELLSAVDDGAEGPAILTRGAVGLRGDNCDFEFRDFRVTGA